MLWESPSNIVPLLLSESVSTAMASAALVQYGDDKAEEFSQAWQRVQRRMAIVEKQYRKNELRLVRYIKNFDKDKYSPTLYLYKGLIEYDRALRRMLFGNHLIGRLVLPDSLPEYNIPSKSPGNDIPAVVVRYLNVLRDSAHHQSQSGHRSLALPASTKAVYDFLKEHDADSGVYVEPAGGEQSTPMQKEGLVPDGSVENELARRPDGTTDGNKTQSEKAGARAGKERDMTDAERIAKLEERARYTEHSLNRIEKAQEQTRSEVHEMRVSITSFTAHMEGMLSSFPTKRDMTNWILQLIAIFVAALAVLFGGVSLFVDLRPELPTVVIERSADLPPTAPVIESNIGPEEGGAITGADEDG